MRISTIFGFLLLVSLGSPSLAFADVGGTANGSVCDLNGSGSGGGYSYNGQCLSQADYPSQSGQSGNSSVTLINPLNSGTSLESFLGNIMDFIIRIGSVVVILMIVYVGYLFVIARGNESKITEARKALLWTVIGALVLLGAKAISSGILATVQSLGG